LEFEFEINSTAAACTFARTPPGSHPSFPCSGCPPARRAHPLAPGRCRPATAATLRQTSPLPPSAPNLLATWHSQTRTPPLLSAFYFLLASEVSLPCHYCRAQPPHALPHLRSDQMPKQERTITLLLSGHTSSSENPCAQQISTFPLLRLTESPWEPIANLPPSVSHLSILFPLRVAPSCHEPD
jgi:hypothetical protein